MWAGNVCIREREREKGDYLLQAGVYISIFAVQACVSK